MTSLQQLMEGDKVAGSAVKTSVCDVKRRGEKRKEAEPNREKEKKEE